MFIRGIGIWEYEQDGSFARKGSVVPWALLLLLLNKDKFYSVRIKKDLHILGSMYKFVFFPHANKLLSLNSVAQKGKHINTVKFSEYI